MPRWRCDFFLTADNDLSAVVERGLEQFRAANPQHVNVVVQIDSPSRRTRRLVLNPNGTFPTLRPNPGTRFNRNVGNPQTLVNFLFASKHLRPARSRMLVLGGHATGVTDLRNFRGIRPRFRPGAIALGIDRSSRDFLDNNELIDALNKFRLRTKYGSRQRAKPQIIGCDACLMATVEIAHQLRQCATYFVASQDNEPANGWPYDAILKTFHDGIHPVRAAINVVSTYGAATANDDEMTLSATALDRMDDLAAALDRLGDALLPFLKTDMTLLARAREEARAFANFDSIDLYGYVQALQRRFGRSTSGTSRRKLIAAADLVIDTLQGAVIATSKPPELSGAHGLSIYLPNSPVIDAYHDLPLSKSAPRWHKFVVDYGETRDRI